MATILVIDHSTATQDAIIEMLVGQTVITASDATTAILQANDTTCDAVIIELSLAGHSGMEFLYEFRSYKDWQHIPVIIYTTLSLQSEVLRSRTWQALNITGYLYKPTSTLKSLKSILDKSLGGYQYTP